MRVSFFLLVTILCMGDALHSQVPNHDGTTCGRVFGWKEVGGKKVYIPLDEPKCHGECDDGNKCELILDEGEEPIESTPCFCRDKT